MPQFYGAIDLVKNELRNAVIQNLGSAPATPSKGQIYMDTTANILYWYSGTAWISAAGATPASTVTNAAINDTGVVGTAITFAREDHKHGMPSFAAPVASTAFGASAVTGTSTSVVHSDHTHGTPTHDDAAHVSAIHLNAHLAAIAQVDAGSQKVVNLATPTVGSDAVNKSYVDGLVQGINWKAPVRVASTANVPVAGTPSTVDGVLLSNGDRLLLKNQTAPAENGLWVYSAGACTRAPDADIGTEMLQAAVFVEEGTAGADTAWVCTTNAPITVGSTALTFVQFGAGGAPTGPASGDLTGTYPGPTIAAGVVTNAKHSNMTGPAIKGLDVGTGPPIDLTPTQLTALLNVFTATLKGLVPASAGGTTTFLRADGTFATPGGGGTVNKFAAALAGTASPETVTHNLNTRDVHVTVYNGATPYTAVEVDWDAATVNTVTIRYSPNLGAGYRVVVLG